MDFKELLFGVSLESVSGSTSVPIASVTTDSRTVSTNTLFIAIRGLRHDGHEHIDDAVKKGAIAIICEYFPEKQTDLVTYVQVPSSRRAY